MRDAAVNGPVSAASPRPTNEARSSPRAVDPAPDESNALRDRFQQALSKRGTSLDDEMEARASEDGGRASMGEMSLPASASSGKEEQGAANRLPEAYAAQTNASQQAAAFVSQGGETAGPAGHAMDTAMLTQFAERMALPASQSGRTIMTLDPAQFRVAEVRIEGAVAEGLSITLKNHSDATGGGAEGEKHQPLEALRARLAARAIPVALLDQT